MEYVLKMISPYLLKILLGWSPCPIENKHMKEFNNPIRQLQLKDQLDEGQALIG